MRPIIPVMMLLVASVVVGQPRSAPRSQPRDAAYRQRAGGRPPAGPRSTAARRAFQGSHPCPATGKTVGACPGYVVDHIVPLKRAGSDSPSNMQWQTVSEAKAKDRVE
jgi:hypothetical protein